jgi:protein involved in polysaccharide export with SLBB domain
MQSTFRIPGRAPAALLAARGLAIAAAVLLTLAPSVAGQQVPTRPAGVSDQQIQQAIQQRGLGDQIRQRVAQSGLTPDQIRARLRAAGYGESLIDSYLTAPAGGQAAPAPTLEIIRAASAIGFLDVTGASDSTMADRDSLVLTRGDSLLADSLGFIIGVDSIPGKRDSLGVLRLDSAAAIRAGARLRRSEVFGLDVFRRASTRFSPVTSGPVDPDYLLGAGDELVLILTGDVELAHSLPVTREGFIVIPQVGQIFVANLAMEQLRNLLYTRLGRVYSGVRRGPGATTHFEVTVSRIRVNQVFVNGEVARPGAYAVSALGTVLNALYQAGGPTERGDFRGVRVLRRGSLFRTVDLYDYLLGGETHDDIRLEQGDVVYAPPRSRRVSIAGSVLRPAFYDLKEGEDLGELIRIAGGLLPEAYTGRAQVERILAPAERAPGGRDRTVLDVDLGAALGTTPAARIALRPGDRIVVFGVGRPVRDRVVLQGNVWRPGTYQLARGMTLSELIRAAGGLKPDTYLERALISRLFPDSTRRLVHADLTGLRPTGEPLGAGDARQGAAVPDIGRPAQDVALQEFDEIIVYSRTGFRPMRQVFIYGSVQRPGSVVFRDSMTLRDLVIQAGGLRDEAYLLEAEIARLPDSIGSGRLATIRKVPLDSTYVLDPTGHIARPTGARGAEPALEPFDNVFIRRVPGYDQPRTVVVSGEVRFPGRYALTRRGEQLVDVVNRAGGVTENAYVRGAQFFRAEGRAGRVGVDLERTLREPGYRDNLTLFPGDSLYVPQYQSVVAVEGAVNSPVGVAYVPNRSAGYYVDRAGGYARRADKGRTYIVQLNGSVMRRSASVEPGARVVVPEVPAGEEKTNWGQILSSVATVLTSALTIILVVQRL